MRDIQIEIHKNKKINKNKKRRSLNFPNVKKCGKFKQNSIDVKKYRIQDELSSIVFDFSRGRMSKSAGISII